jgi:hypothetical protein
MALALRMTRSVEEKLPIFGGAHIKQDLVHRSQPYGRPAHLFVLTRGSAFLN